MILLRRYCISPDGVLNTLLLRYPQRKTHMGLSQETLVATLGHDSTKYPVATKFVSLSLIIMCRLAGAPSQTHINA